MERQQLWTFYQSIEDDLRNTANYIHFSQENYGTYSVELAKILLTTCIEIERQLKTISAYIQKKDKTKFQNINQWHESITTHFPEFCHFNAFGIIWPGTYSPWKQWSENQSPDWWKAYSKVKHDRLDNLCLANLKKTIDAVAGLFVSTFYYERTFNGTTPNSGSGIRITVPLALLPRLFKPWEEWHNLLGSPCTYCYDFAPI